MWIERVVARAFGPFQNEVLELVPGMNVIYGPNEAGKTSWHAATRMALTGVRRGRGSSTREAAEVEDRHRPWDSPDAWQVEARLHLADGRTIDISQDLAGKVACRAVDATLGQDVSAEITPIDGTPDAAMWLGLDRDAFAVTMSVNQSQILAVAADPGGLQEHMQRAAASAATDATAAAAIERLVAFRRDAVGATTTVAKGPLRSAMRAVTEADDAAAEAHRRHSAYLDRTARAEVAAVAETAARRTLALAQLTASRERATALAARLARAEILAAAHPAEPPALAALDEQASAVAGALSAWRQRPVAGQRATRPVGDIQAELAAVRTSTTDEVARAERELQQATAERDAIPPPPEPRAAAGAPTWLLPLAAGLVVAGLAAGVAGFVPVAVLVVVAGLAAGGWWWFARRPAPSVADPRAAAREQADARVATATEALEVVRRSAEAESARLVALGHELDAATAANAMAAEAEGLAAHAEQALRAAAGSVGLDASADPGQLVTGLETWQAERLAAIDRGQQAIREYQELMGLLEGGSIDDLRASAAAAMAAADQLGATGGSGTPAGPVLTEDEARRQLDAAQQQAAALAGELSVLEADLPDVAEAEEAATAARQRLDEVTALASVIDETLELLRGAQRGVHQDLAPVLKTTIDAWLPRLTEGAYVEAGVNPADLSIEVKEAATGQWRHARLLSEGTREQIYLLLRVAMATHLVTTHEVAPLLLDEVTAQADESRRERLLEMLHELSAERQIVVFSHEPAVRDWARRTLRVERDRLVELPVGSGRRTGVAALPVAAD